MSSSIAPPAGVASATPTPQDSGPPTSLKPIYFLTWLLCAIFYAYQYAARSAPGVMQTELAAAWGGNHIGAIISAYYVAYALMALAAGQLLDRYGARRTVPYGIALVSLSCVIFAQGSVQAGAFGFVIQAIGAVFGFIGASYVAARYLPARLLAVFVGLTQCLGMAGAAFGSKPVRSAIDPAGSIHMPWQHIWMVFAVIGLILAVTTWFVMPSEKGDSPDHHGPVSATNLLAPFKVVFGNVQSWLAGLIGGLLFAPTTIGALVWATVFLHNGEHMTMSSAASDVSMVPIGWVIGCPLIGYISDRLGRRKPVLIGGAVLVLAAWLVAIYLPTGTFPKYSVALLLGIGSGAAMLPFSMIKEANPAGVKGTSAGVMNFLVFFTTGLMSPFIADRMVARPGASLDLSGFQQAALPLSIGIMVAIILSFVIRETGAGHKPASVTS